MAGCATGTRVRVDAPYRPPSLFPRSCLPSSQLLHPLAAPGRPQQPPDPPGRTPEVARFSSALAVTRRFPAGGTDGSAPSGGPPIATASSRGPRPRKAPLGSDRGNWTLSPPPRNTYAQLARRSPSRMVLTAIAARFREICGGCILGRPPRRGSSCVLRFQTTALTPTPVTKDWWPLTRALACLCLPRALGHLQLPLVLTSISGGRAVGFLTLPV